MPHSTAKFSFRVGSHSITACSRDINHLDVESSAIFVKSCNTICQSLLRHDPTDTELRATRTLDLPEFKSGRTEIALHQKLSQLAQNPMRGGIGQHPGRILQDDRDADPIQADVSEPERFHAPVKILFHQGRLRCDDGGEVIAFGRQVPILGEVDAV